MRRCFSFYFQFWKSFIHRFVGVFEICKFTIHFSEIHSLKSVKQLLDSQHDSEQKPKYRGEYQEQFISVGKHNRIRKPSLIREKREIQNGYCK